RVSAGAARACPCQVPRLPSGWVPHQICETRGAAATPPLALEGPVQPDHGTAALTQGPWSPRDGAQLGACTRTVDVRDLGGRTLPPPDALASAGDIFCTM
uniref:BCL2 binding component 3 n=1 Tax=Rhinolophus ferrumequinum TaxID=59479 RepID=A0A671F4F5_RHIFE